MKRLTLITAILILTLMLSISPVLAAPPQPSYPEWAEKIDIDGDSITDFAADIHCFEYGDPIAYYLPEYGDPFVTSDHFEVAVIYYIEQFKNNKNKMTMNIYTELWAEGYGIVYDTFIPYDYPYFPSCP